MLSYRIRSHRELYALVARAKEISSKPVAYWTIKEISVMEFANEHSKDAGYLDWKDAYTQLKKKIVDTSHQNS